MKTTAIAILALAAVATGLTLASRTDLPSPTGTWKWSVTAGGTVLETKLTLKRDGDRLTGVLTDPEGQEAPIEEATYEDGELSFKVARERNGQAITTRFSGKVSAETITGQIESPGRGSATVSRPWAAKRAAL